jgi:hypothetical protein
MTPGSTRGNKVDRAIERWDLTDIGDELESRWLGEGREDHSLRELSTYFNKQILTAALTEAGTVPLEGEVDNYHTLFTSEDVARADVLQAEQRLTQMGADPEEVRDSFVSHQTLYRYLTNVRAVEKESDTESFEDVVESTRRTNDRLTNRLKAVVEQSLHTLAGRSGFNLGEFDVYVDVQIACADCGTSRTLKQILDHRGCDCQ